MRRGSTYLDLGSELVVASAKHVVEILGGAKCVGLAVSVQNNQHLIQMAHSWLLSEGSLRDPKVYF